MTDTVADQIKRLETRADWWEKRCKTLEEKIEQIEGRKLSAEQAADAQDAANERAANTELRRARAAAIRALVKLLPEAVRQARAKPPRPALLRLILRATR